MLRKVLSFLALFFVIGYLFLSWKLSARVLNPGSSMELTQKRIVEQQGTTFEEMMTELPVPSDYEVESFDGTVLRGKYFVKSDSTDCAIILSHGFSATWAGMLKFERVLRDCDCDIVVYDQRAHGESGGEYPTGGINEAKDLLAITDWVGEKTGFPDSKIGWVGASWGAATVLNAGADEREMAFIIADAAFQDWYTAIFERAEKEYGLMAKVIGPGVMQVVNWRTGVEYRKASSLNLASEIDEPVLLIHSKFDSQTGYQQSVNISKKLNDRSTTHILDWGGDHTRDVFQNREKYQVLVNDFLRKQGFVK